jgi:hypothetical protein
MLVSLTLRHHLWKKVCHGLWKIIRRVPYARQEQDDRIASLNPIVQAEWESGNVPKRCLEGTREDLVADADKWFNDPDAPSVYWLLGTSGAGKSAFAHTFCYRCKQKMNFGASFFFSREEGCKTVDGLLLTLAHRLCFSFPALKAPISEALRDTSILKSVPERQLRSLILDPVREIFSSKPPPILLVIDALDRCEGKRGDNSTIHIQNLVTLLIAEAATCFKILFTSRSDDHLQGIRSRWSASIETRNLEDFAQVTEIQKYVQSKMNEYEKQFRGQCGWTPNAIWPSDDDIQAVVNMAGSLFLSATTILLALISPEGADPRQKLRAWQSAHNETLDLDALYLEIWESAARSHPDGAERDELRLLIAFLVLSFGPLPVKSIDKLLGVTSLTFFPTLRPVIEVRGNNGTLHTLHPSFHDFITDSGRCQSTHLQSISPQEYHAKLAKQCFKVLKELKRDFLGSGGPANINSMADSQVFRDDLSYAVKYWEWHAAGSARDGVIDDLEVIKEINDFAQKRVLYWVEALSYLGCLAEGQQGLVKIVKVISVRITSLRSHYSG